MCPTPPFSVNLFAILAQVCFSVNRKGRDEQDHSILRNYGVSRLFFFFKEPVSLSYLLIENRGISNFY